MTGLQSAGGVNALLVPLQASCDRALDCWANANFLDAMIQGLQQNAPIAVFALIVLVCLYYGLYYWSKTHTVPIVTLVLMGGAVFPLLPAAAARLAWLAILLTGGLALFALYWAVIR